MAIFYPRRQTLFIFILCVIAVAATAYYSLGQSLKQSAKTNKAVLADVVDSAVTQPIDTGTDWQKQFMDVSTTSAPFKAGTTKKAADPKAVPLTATDLLGREFLTKYAEMHQAGLTTDPQTVDNVTSQLVNDSLANVPTPVAYAISSIRKMQTTDVGTLKTYAEKVRGILSAYIPDQDHNEAVIAEQALDQNDMTILKFIDPVITNYRTAIKTLLAMPVPGPIASYHLQLINGINIALFNAQSLRNINTDPVKGMAAISMEIAGLQAMNDAMTSIKTYFIAAGVPFNS